MPDMGALVGHAELAGSLGLGAALGEQLGGAQPSGLTGGTLILGLDGGWSTSPDPHTASTQPSTQPTGEVAQRLGLGLDPVQPGGVGEHVGEFDGVGRGPVGDPAVGASGQVRG